MVPIVYKQRLALTPRLFLQKKEIDIKVALIAAYSSLLPEKSKHHYEVAYISFEEWFHIRNASEPSETVILWTKPRYLSLCSANP